MDPHISSSALSLVLSLASEIKKPKPQMLFVYKKERNCPADDDVLSAIQTTKERFDKEFAPQLNRISRLFHERLAKGSSVSQTHEEWLSETKTVLSSMTQSITQAKDHYKYIPLLTNTHKIAKAASAMLYLGVIAPTLEQKAQTLCRLLASEHHREAFEYYKKQLKACEALHTKLSADEKICDLFAIFKDAKETIKRVGYELQGKDDAVIAESTAFYQEVLLYIQYATNALERQLQEEVSEFKEARLDRLQKLTASIKKRLAPHLRGLLESEDCEPHGYIVESRTYSLPADNHFRSGIYLANLRYSRIWPHIEKLTDIAKASYRLHNTIRERIQVVLEGELAPTKGFDHLRNEIEHYKNLINTLEKAVYAALAALAKQPLSKESHAGWYYVADLLTQVKEVRESITQLSQIVLEKHKFCTVAISRLVRFLELANPGLKPDPNYVNVETIIRLYAATNAATSFTIKEISFSKRAYKTIYETLSVVGARVLELQDNETQVPNKVFSKSPFAQDEQELLQSYLMKNLLRLTRFSETPADFEFDLVLFTLQESQEFAKTYDDILKKSSDIQNLLDAYNRQNNRGNLFSEFLIMRQALFALSEANANSSKFDMLMSYYEAKQLLFDLKEKPQASMKERLIWLERKINDFARAHDEALNIDSLDNRKLFMPLIVALFSSNFTACHDASAEITSVIQQDGFIPSAPDSIIGKLLERWQSK